MLTSILGILYFIIAISIIVVIHELGHLIVAKRNGVKCFEFSIGMGPKLFTFYTDKQGTIYNVRAIPLGGYVMMAGEEEAKEMKFDAEESLNNKKPWQKIKILFAGAGMNFILGFVVFFLMFFFLGVEQPIETNQVVITANSPMEKSGMNTGDKILEIDNQEISNYADIQDALADTDNVAITFENSSQDVQTVEVTPEQIDCDATVYGVSPETEYNSFKLIDSIKSAGLGFVSIVGSIGESLRLLLNGTAGVGDLMGPIGIADASSNVVSSGLRMMLATLAYLSINIGIVNLLPFPALDGGRMVLAFYELITKRRVNEKFEMYLNALGFILLMGLFVVVTFSDVGRLGATEYYNMDVNSTTVCARDTEQVKYHIDFEQVEDELPQSVTVELSTSDGVISKVTANGSSFNEDSAKTLFEYSGTNQITTIAKEGIDVVIEPDSVATKPLDLTIKVYDEKDDVINQAIYRIER